jgi:hypothetical protein
MIRISAVIDFRCTKYHLDSYAALFHPRDNLNSAYRETFLISVCLTTAVSNRLYLREQNVFQSLKTYCVRHFEVLG